MIKIALLALSTGILGGTDSVSVADEASARVFFEQHNARGEAFDVAVADDYADDAVITARRVSADGSERLLQVSGKQWKMLVSTGMELAKQRGDISKYSDEVVQVDGTRATISATRYSVSKCYYDQEYQKVLERQSDGGYLIVSEHMYNQAQSSCEAAEGAQ